MRSIIYYAMHVALGALMGLVMSFVFLMLYYFTIWDIPVSDAVRFRSAFWITTFISLVLFGLLFWREIVVELRKIAEAEEADATDAKKE